MACTNSTTFYWPGASFASTSTIYSDPAFTTVAPDGWYQQAGIYREMSGGVLGGPTSCPTCLLPCNTNLSASGTVGQYFASGYIGNATGVIIIRFDPYSFPDRCIWSYDYDNSGTPTVASEYSSATLGYMSGLIGTISTAQSQCDPPPIIGYTNALGSSGQVSVGNRYDYDFSINGFPIVPTSFGTQVMGPYLPQGSASIDAVDFKTNSPGWCMMVMPKPNPLQDTFDLVVDGPCSGTNWDMFVSCPTPLNIFKCATSPTPACTGTTDSFFTAHPGNVLGAATDVFVHDWAFEDQFGVTKKAAGTYLVEGGTAGPVCVVVSGNGVVTNVTPCVGNC